MKRSSVLLGMASVVGVAIGIYSQLSSNPALIEAIDVSGSSVHENISIPAPTPFGVVGAIESGTANSDAEPILQGGSHSVALNKSIDELEHYLEVLAYLQHIKEAGADQLEFLLAGLYETGSDTVFSKMIATAIHQRYAVVDFEAALDYVVNALENTNALNNQWAQGGLATLASMDPDAVLERVESLNGSEHSLDIAAAVYTKMAETNAERLARRVIENPSIGHDNFEVLSVAISEWSIKDPESVWDFLQDEASEEVRSVLVGQVLNTWLENDPDAAIVEIEALLYSGGQGQQHGVANLYISHLSEIDPDAVYQWALYQEDIAVREQALTSIVDGWNTNDADGLVTFVSQMDNDMRERYEPAATSKLLQQVMMLDPENAATWIHEQTNAEVREVGSVYLSSIDSSTDTHTALESLAELQGEHREFMLFSVVSDRLATDPEAVEEWVTNTRLLTALEREILLQMPSDDLLDGLDPAG